MIYFVRHGERREQRTRQKREVKIKDTKNMSEKARNKYLKKLEARNFNDPLTPLGIRQAKQVAQLLTNKNITIIYSSPLKRCTQTANIIAKILKAPIVVDERLGERGSYNHVRHLPDEQFNELWENYLNYNYKTNLIEDASHFVERVRSALTDINNKHKNENVLVVAHSCLTYAINVIENGLPKDGMILHDKIDNDVVRKLNI